MIEEAEHLVTLLEASIHKVVPAVPGVVSPVRIRNESASVLIVTSLVLSGEKVEVPLAVKVWPVATVAPPLKVASPVPVKVPVTTKSLLTVVVPVPAPSDRVVAAPPMLKLVAPELNKVAVPEVVVISPPFTATSPEVKTFPVKVEVPSMVKLPLAWIVPELEMETPAVPYPPPIFTTSNPAVAAFAVKLVALAKLTVRLLIVAVPVAAPKVRVVAAPPIDKLVAPVLNSVAVPEVVVISPPFTAKSPEVRTFPVKVEVPSTVRLPLAWIVPMLEMEAPVEP